jgi:hypothetical protein
LRDGLTLYAYESSDVAEVDLFVEADKHVGLVADTRFVFRSSSPATSQVRTIAIDVFDDFWAGLPLIDSQPARNEASVRVASTVVAATTGTVDVDDTGAVSERRITALFDKAFGQLNEFLTMLGFTSSTAEIGAVRRTELPTHIPVVLDLAGDPAARRAELSLLQLHGFQSDPTPSEEAVIMAHDLAFRDRLRAWPLRAVVVLLHRAGRDRYAGLHDQCVLGLATALEILVEATIAGKLQIDGEASRVENVLRAGLTNLVRDHVAPWLGGAARDSAVCDRWLADCYRLRKRVAHEGHMPTHDEVLVAWHASNELAAEIGAALRADTRFAEQGLELPIGPIGGD